MDEFALIRRYFAGLVPGATDVLLGIGDDCALLQSPTGEDLAVTTDTLVEGRHFPADTAAFDVGWKALAVNLSDLAAMGARPRWFTLALTLPEADGHWLGDFATGLRACAQGTGIALVGGDTTRGPRAITITAIGSVEATRALRRDGARPGDAICVTGSLGDAALGLRLWPQGAQDADHAFLFGRLQRPQPRLEAGRALRGLAHAAIDLSDGLAGDLGHILAASGVGATIDPARLPMSPAFERCCPSGQRHVLQLSGGDDYELCVCLPPEHLASARAALEVPLTQIGRVNAAPGLSCLAPDGRVLPLEAGGYRHFA